MSARGSLILIMYLFAKSGRGGTMTGKVQRFRSIARKTFCEKYSDAEYTTLH